MFSKKFQNQELGHLKYFMGIKVTHSKSKIFISQKYIYDLLKDIDKLACQPTKHSCWF